MVDIDYKSFLDTKVNLGDGSGFEPIEIPDFLFDFQKSLVSWAIRRGRAAIYADCGMGKGFRPDCPILTPTGWKPIGDLVIGDLVIGSDGTPYPVSGVYFRGEQDIYRVVFSDSSLIECDGDHLWNVKSFNDVARGKPWRTMNTVDLSRTKLKYGIHGQSRTWQIPLVDPVEFEDRDFVIHPYLMGVLLGDGSFRENTVMWTKEDREIANRVAGLLPDDIHVVRVDKGDRCVSWRVSMTAKGRVDNPILDAIRDLGLFGLKSDDKFVPHGYLFSSVESRLALLQGLMDTDGYAGESPEFSSSSKNLAESVVFLVRSLGGTASLNCKEEPTYTYDGEKKIGLPSWRVVMTMPPGINPFSLARKADKFKTPSRGRGRWVDSIEPVGRGETVCIAVDSPDHLFVADQFLVTHNTPCQLVWADNVVRRTNKPVLILAPLAVGFQTVREAEKFGIQAMHSKTGLPPDARIVVTNYERLHYFSPNDFAGVVADESSILKNVHGKTKAAVIEFMRTIPYRLLCTATAAPNDYVELGTSSEALGELGYQDMITRFFKQEYQGKHTAWGRLKYRLRGYAEHDFWRWVCSWARACRRPSDLGFDDGPFVLPTLETREHSILARTKRDGFLFDLPPSGFREEREESRRTIEERCEKSAELVKAHPGHSIVWCFLNPEGDLLERLIPGSVQVSGSDKEEAKEQAVEWFTQADNGHKRVLISKPKMFGYGLNLQCSNHQVFFPSNSYEQFYQAVRRSWRFGQANPVTIDIVTTEGEVGVMANLQRKSVQAESMFSSLVELMNNELHISRSNPFTEQSEVPTWLNGN